MPRNLRKIQRGNPTGSGDPLRSTAGGSPPAAGGYATPSAVQHGAEYAYSSGVTLPGNATAGNLLVAFVGGNSATTNTALSGGCTSWTALTARSYASSGYNRLFYCIASGGSTTVTATNMPDDGGLTVVEFSNIDVSTPYVSEGSIDTSLGNPQTWTTSTITTTRDNALIVVGIIDESAGGTIVYTSPSATIHEETGHQDSVGARVCGASGDYTVAGTRGTANTGANLVWAVFNAKSL